MRQKIGFLKGMRGLRSNTSKLGRSALHMGLGMTTVSLVVGCGSASAPSSELARVSKMTPGSWVASREGQVGVDNAWVSRFGDSRLTALVGEAIANNPDISIAEERVMEAVTLARKAQAPALPQASGSLSGRRNKQNFVGFPDFGGGAAGGQNEVISTLSNTFGASLDVSWEPDIWGKVAAANAAELARIQAEGNALRAVRASLAGQVVKAWLALGEANEQLELARFNLDIREKTLAAVQERFASALVDDGGTASQLRLVRTDVATAKQSVVQRESEVARAKRQVELLVARYPAGLVGRGGVQLPKLPAKPPAGLPSGLLKRRPDVLEAERRYAASLKDITEADLARFPSLSLTSSAGRSSSEVKNLLDSDFGVWSLAGNIAVPILNGGRLKADFEAARSRSRRALASLQASVLDAFGEVEQALVADEYFDRQIAAGEAALAEAVAADDASARDYADGVETILGVLEARGSRTQIATQLVTLRRQRLENRVNLHLALGGDFQLRGK
jgi:NodT family efflux transporter outer membrane factor (OMF) lipoprotein